MTQMTETQRAAAKVRAIDAMADTCRVGHAAAAAGVTRRTLNQWLLDDPAFAAEFRMAERVGVTVLEDEAKRRAFEGVEEPVVFQGQFTPMVDAQGNVIVDGLGRPRFLTVRKFSDSLVALLLKAHDPEKYAERSKVSMDGNVTVANALLAARKRVGQT